MGWVGEWAGWAGRALADFRSRREVPGLVGHGGSGPEASGQGAGRDMGLRAHRAWGPLPGLTREPE